MHTRILGITLSVALLAGPVLAAPAGGGFRLQDYLGRRWRNELVSFPIAGADLQHARAGHVLAGPDGQPVPYQLAVGASPREGRIAFLAELDPFETRVYRFGSRRAPAPTDLKVDETPDAVRLVNGRTGIALAKKLPPGGGPILGVMLASGKWAGGSRLRTDLPVAGYTLRVAARGPAFADAVCRAVFVDGQAWELRVRLQANEPVVLLDESCSVRGEGTALLLSLTPGLSPDTLFFRFGQQTANGPIGKNAAAPISPGEVFVLEPWLHWWEQERQGACFGVYNAAGPDLLAVGAGEAGVWVDPELPREAQAPPRVAAAQEGGDLHLTFPIRTGRRKWMIEALAKADVLPVLREKEPCLSPLTQEYLIKHGHFPLDLVKEYVLRWPADKKPYPRLFFTPADLERIRRRAQPGQYDKEIEGYIRNPIYDYQLDGPIAAYLATGNPQLGRKLAETATQWLQDSVDLYLKQNGIPLGCAPHHQQHVATTLLLLDTVLSDPQLAPELRERLLAQAAFLGCVFERPEYWSPARGFAANPNMTTSVYGYKAIVACLIPSHPRAAAWVQDAMAELKRQRDTWSDENGGWLEAPHYAMVSYDQMLGAFLMAQRAGFNEYLFDPRMKKIIEWFGKISTPPDSRLAGARHLPCLGNTYLCEPTGEFGILAGLWREKDPEFAARMQWLFHQHRSYGQPGIGGGYPALSGYRSLLLDPTLPEEAPDWKSELFPETGAVLRNAYPSERETQLTLIAGRHHDHYDNDSGSITLWGKGRILADDFGYYGMAPAEDHSLVETAGAQGLMAVKEFVPGDGADYLAGVKGAWTRQILFLKDPDPLAPNYFVIADSLADAADATWRLWLTAANVTPRPGGALVEGKEDVDLDVFFAWPAGIALRTEEKTRKSGSGMSPNGSWGPMSSTQTGLIATVEKAAGFTAVLYPRLKTEGPPAITPLAGGRGVKVETPAGTDYVFLTAKPFAFREGDLSFEGTAGAVRIRGDQATLFLPAPGSIAARGKELRR